MQMKEEVRVSAGPDAQDGDGAHHGGLDGAGRLRAELRAPRQAPGARFNTDPKNVPKNVPKIVPKITAKKSKKYELHAVCFIRDSL